ncbi:hypothetical protein [Spirochaeta lutea]|uniref:hypothetical protein n=1 Tax=Spirochaeta lutea TaxID=1480694 RepID=UPI000A5EBA88|nr:hypothetical protein [Spirochaeta lutea]
MVSVYTKKPVPASHEPGQTPVLVDDDPRRYETFPVSRGLPDRRARNPAALHQEGGRFRLSLPGGAGKLSPASGRRTRPTVLPGCYALDSATIRRRTV